MDKNTLITSGFLAWAAAIYFQGFDRSDFHEDRFGVARVENFKYFVNVNLLMMVASMFIVVVNTGDIYGAVGMAMGSLMFGMPLGFILVGMLGQVLLTSSVKKMVKDGIDEDVMYDNYRTTLKSVAFLYIITSIPYWVFFTNALSNK